MEPVVAFAYTPHVDEKTLISGDQRAGHYTRRFGATGQRLTLSLVNTVRSKRVVKPGC